MNCRLPPRVQSPPPFCIRVNLTLHLLYNILDTLPALRGVSSYQRRQRSHDIDEDCLFGPFGSCLGDSPRNEVRPPAQTKSGGIGNDSLYDNTTAFCRLLEGEATMANNYQ